jgi:hypothetical protein
MTDSHNRATGITPTRYRPFLTEAIPQIPRFLLPQSSPGASHTIHRACSRTANPPKPIPILRVQTLAYARVSLARAFRPALSKPARTAPDRTHAEPIRTIRSCSTALPGCSSQAASHHGQGSDRRLPSERTAGPAPSRLSLSSSPAEADAGGLLPLLGCQWHGPGDSSLVAGGVRRDSTLCDQSIRYGLTARPACSFIGACWRCTWVLRSCESVVGAFAEAETAA